MTRDEPNHFAEEESDDVDGPYAQRSNLRPLQQCCACHGGSPERLILFCNGQVGARLDGTVPEDPREQIEVIFERIRIILAASNMTFEDVVKFTVYVTDKSILEDYFRIRGRIMGDHDPPATLLVVKQFPRSGVEVEIETIAAKAD